MIGEFLAASDRHIRAMHSAFGQFRQAVPYGDSVTR
jgi:hypothetical protein